MALAYPDLKDPSVNVAPLPVHERVAPTHGTTTTIETILNIGLEAFSRYQKAAGENHSVTIVTPDSADAYFSVLHDLHPQHAVEMSKLGKQLDGILASLPARVSHDEYIKYLNQELRRVTTKHEELYPTQSSAPFPGSARDILRQNSTRSKSLHNDTVGWSRAKAYIADHGLQPPTDQPPTNFEAPQPVDTTQKHITPIRYRNFNMDPTIEYAKGVCDLASKLARDAILVPGDQTVFGRALKAKGVILRLFQPSEQAFR